MPVGRAAALAEAQRLRETETAIIVTEKMNAEAQLAALRSAVAAVGAGESSKVIYKGASFTKLLTFFADNSKQGGAAE